MATQPCAPRCSVPMLEENPGEKTTNNKQVNTSGENTTLGGEPLARAAKGQRTGASFLEHEFCEFLWFS